MAVPEYHAGAEGAVFLEVAACEAVLVGEAAGGMRRVGVDTRALVGEVAIFAAAGVVAGAGEGAVGALPTQISAAVS